MNGITRAATCVLSLAAALGCDHPLDTARETRERGTFGAEVFDVACQRVAYGDDLARATGKLDVSGDDYRRYCREVVLTGAAGAAGVGAAGASGAGGASGPTSGGDAGRFPRAGTLKGVRGTLIAAIDAALPKPYLDRLEQLLLDLLPLYDDGAMVAGTDAIVKALSSLQADKALHAALSRLSERLGYRPLGPAALGAVRAIAAYPRLPQFLDAHLSLLDQMGKGNAQWKEVLRSTAATLQSSQVQPVVSAQDRTLKLATTLLIEEDPGLPAASRAPKLLVARDHRGLALVEARTSGVPLPFVDRDGDGLADADDAGNFVDQSGRPLFVPSPFAKPGGDGAARDAMGRALMGGQPVYHYVDLSRTMLGALSAEALVLADPAKDTALKLLQGTEAVLGPRTMQTRVLDDGKPFLFMGFDTRVAPLLDLTYSLLQLLSDPDGDDSLGIAETLFRDHAAVTAAAIGEMLAQNDRGQAHAEAVLDESATFYDDLAQILVRTMAVPGLAEDLVKAFAHPDTQLLWPMLSEYFKYNDKIGVDPQTQRVVGNLATPVNRGQSDSGFNRSAQQRLFHLIADSNGVKLCSKAGARVEVLGIGLRTYDNPCELFQVDDTAVFFMQSIVEGKNADGTHTGKPKARLNLNLGFLDPLTPDALIETLSTIKGFGRNPTPEALARVLFLDPPPQFIANTQDAQKCSEGKTFIEHHGSTIFAWEVRPFYKAIKPILQAFADHDSEKIFADSTALLHRHWASRSSMDHQSRDAAAPSYVVGTGLRSYEPLLDETFSSQLLPKLVALTQTLIDLKIHGNDPALPALVKTTRYLFDPSVHAGSPLPPRGSCPMLGPGGTCHARRGDGKDGGPLTPYLLMADAYKERRAAVAGGGQAGQAWKTGTSTVVDQLLSVATGQFRNPRMAPMAARLVGFLRARVAAHKRAGDLEAWVRQRLPADLEGTMGSPVFAALVDLTKVMSEDEPARVELYALMQYLVDAAGNDEAFLTALTAAGDLLQMLIDDPNLVPVLRAVGNIMDPKLGILDAQTHFLRRANEVDKAHALAELFKGLYAEHRPGSAPVLDIVDVLAEVHRKSPGAGGRFAPEDYEAAFKAVAEFVGDEKRGLKKFIEIVQQRKVP